MTAKERWDNWHWTTRLSVVFGLIAAIWVGVTAALNTADHRYITRREQDRYRDSLAAAAVLRDLRDSARQENVYRALRYNACLTRMKGRDAPCAHLTTP